MNDLVADLPLCGPGREPVDLWRTLNSHGFAELPPLRLDEDARTLDLTIRLPRGAPRRIRIAQGPRRTARVTVVGGGAPTTSQRAHLARAATGVLHLRQDLSGFYALAAEDPALAWVTAGAGRMLRSPTVWEDVVKTVCTTNCSCIAPSKWATTSCARPIF